MKEYSRVCAKVDLDAIKYNIQSMYENLEGPSEVMAVIKADGYGHGSVQIARVLESNDYIWGFAVATADEAVVLRNAGITKPLLVLGCVFPEQYEIVMDYDIQVMIYRLETAQELSELAGKLNKNVGMHIKLDTGMGRIGFPVSEESVEVIQKIKDLPNLNILGLCTHFAKADETDKTFTNQQLEKYLWMKEMLNKRGIEFTYYHCSNSAAIIDIKPAHMNLVRAGISTYGLYPSTEVNKTEVHLKPAMSLISHVSHVKWVESGTPVSYGGTYITSQKTKIATVPVGYGDGYPRSLSSRGHTLINGKRAPIIGRVCMDQFMVDVTDIEGVEFATQVTLIGTDSGECITVEDLGDISGRFNYEFVCDLGKRIPREYLLDGKTVEQVDYFN